MRVRRAGALVGVASALAGVPAGCGGGGGGGGAPAAGRTAAAPAAPPRDCIVRPARCGYPDAATTGVPAGTPLVPSGPITVTTPGTTIARRDVRGAIVVQADGVTIRDTRVTVADPQGAAIFVAPKVRGTRILDSTLRGRDARAGAVQYGILNAGWPPNATTVAERVRMDRCTTCYAGPGTLRDSYVDVDATVPGAHYEPVYYGGGAGPLTVVHDTLLNRRPQTAIVFAGSDYGPQRHLTIAGNLMAGGGWMIYAGGSDPRTRDVRITGNRLSTRFFPRGGHFGTSAEVAWRHTRWSGNVWDGTLRPAAG